MVALRMQGVHSLARILQPELNVALGLHPESQPWSSAHVGYLGVVFAYERPIAPGLGLASWGFNCGQHHVRRGAVVLVGVEGFHLQHTTKCQPSELASLVSLAHTRSGACDVMYTISKILV